MSDEQRAPRGACHEMRRRAGAAGNAVIDEFVGGHISRRELLRYLSVLGLSGPLWGATPAHAARVNGTSDTPGATVTVGMTVPAGLIDPLTVADTGGVCLLSQTAEYLAVSGPDLHLQPVLAESWQPNEDGSVWTFKIRRGVKFHNGRALSAADVVATMDRLADPANGSVALSVFSGVLSKGGTRASDDVTVEFHLDAPNGSFPYLVSSDNYSAIILPADYDGGFENSFIGTGPFRLERYASRDRASFVRNPDYWGDRALPERTSFIFYDSIQAQILAMQGEQLDVLLHAPVQGSQALLSDPRLNVLALKSSAHQQVHMRCDRGAFIDARVRRALALCLNRETIVTGLFRGLAAIGNDSPFAPVFAATDPQVPQRRQDLSRARELLSAAGLGRGFRATLTAERFIEIPDYAVVIQNAVRQIGVQLKLNIEDQSAYFGRATFGQSDWLDCEMGIEDYAHRGVPNIFLSAALGSRGTFNAAHFKNPDYDRLVAGYVAALDPASQREAAGRIQRLLLEETPIIAAYFYDWLSVTTKRIRGVRPSASGQLFLDLAQRN
jgi:peptide/nickel transport system substrate-binding protein